MDPYWSTFLVRKVQSPHIEAMTNWIKAHNLKRIYSFCHLRFSSPSFFVLESSDFRVSRGSWTNLGQSIDAGVPPGRVEFGVSKSSTGMSCESRSQQDSSGDVVLPITLDVGDIRWCVHVWTIFLGDSLGLMVKNHHHPSCPMTSFQAPQKSMPITSSYLVLRNYWRIIAKLMRHTRRRVKKELQDSLAKFKKARQGNVTPVGDISPRRAGYTLCE